MVYWMEERGREGATCTHDEGMHMLEEIDKGGGGGGGGEI